MNKSKLLWFRKILNRLTTKISFGYYYSKSFYPNYTTLKEIKWYAFDIESTGLNPKQDRIIEISFVPIFKQVISLSDIFTIQILQDNINTPAVAIHEIIQSDYQQEAYTEAFAVEVICEKLKDGVLLGYFSKLDKDLLTSAFRRQQNKSFSIPVIDLAHLLKRARVEYSDENLPKHNWQLSEVCQSFGIPLEGAHTSAGDALATALIFMHLEKDLMKRGIWTWGRLKESMV